MSIRLILFFPLVSNCCQVMQLKRNEMYKISRSFFVIDDMITQTIIYFLGGGGGGGVGAGGINCKSSQTSC